MSNLRVFAEKSVVKIIRWSAIRVRTCTVLVRLPQNPTHFKDGLKPIDLFDILVFHFSCCIMTSAANAAPSFLFPSTGFDANKQRPKSPKSPKVLTIDNPLLKSPQFLFGGGRTAANSAAPSLRPENDQQQSQARSPLLSVSVNRPRPTQRTPGPPPKASLSLMGMLPVEVS